MRALAPFAVLAALAAAAPDVQAEEARLRAVIEAQGAEITLGDLFENAGPASQHVVAPAPQPGGQARLSGALVAAAAAQAGLSWPAGNADAVIVRGQRIAARTAAARAVSAGQALGAGASPADVRRGDIVTVSYVLPGLRLGARMRAMSDGAAGDTIRLANLQSNRIIDARVTGPGAAQAAVSP
jgi:flagella basal body P-ring formation protein FlgA